MLIVQVAIVVKAESIYDFIAATTENAKQSLKEKGIVRFDFLQNQENPAKFILNEVYRNADAPAEHKETEHYKKWKNSVEMMMAEPRFSNKYTNIFPTDQQY